MMRLIVHEQSLGLTQPIIIILTTNRRDDDVLRARQSSHIPPIISTPALHPSARPYKSKSIIHLRVCVEHQSKKINQPHDWFVATGHVSSFAPERLGKLAASAPTRPHNHPSGQPAVVDWSVDCIMDGLDNRG